MAWSLWNPVKGKTYQYIDRCISEYFGMSGTALYVHALLGTQTTDANGTVTTGNLTTIQDVLFLENRDRIYSNSICELRGIYSINEVAFDLKQFGYFLGSDTIFVEIHLNDCVARMGRKIINGDVIELPHLRDDALLSPDAAAINKYYVVEDVQRASDGYSPTWFPHILRIKCNPMVASQEVQNILNQTPTDPFGLPMANTLGSMISTIGTEMNINQQVIDAAVASVGGRNFQTQQFYVVPGDETTGQFPWVFAGDGVPPDGAVLAGSGSAWPLSPNAGDYYLRTDFKPNALFQYNNGKWVMQEQDYRQSDWSAAHRILLDFINDDNQATFSDGLTQSEKQPLYKAVKPRADF